MFANICRWWINTRIQHSCSLNLYLPQISDTGSGRLQEPEWHSFDTTHSTNVHQPHFRTDSERVSTFLLIQNNKLQVQNKYRNDRTSFASLRHQYIYHRSAKIATFNKIVAPWIGVVPTSLVRVYKTVWRCLATGPNSFKVRLSKD